MKEHPSQQEADNGRAFLILKNLAEDEWENLEEPRRNAEINLYDCPPNSREELEALVLPPLKEAVGILYDKNIRVFYGSHMRKEYFESKLYFRLAWELLSEANRKLILDHGHFEMKRSNAFGEEVRYVKVYVPFDLTDTPDTAGIHATELARKFEAQFLS